MDLAAVAADLYGSMPGDFVSRRTEAAKGTGDKEAAKAIRALPKPSSAAWLVNMLVRHRRDRIDAVLALGEDMRAAQENLDAERLRGLSADRRALLAALERESADLAKELGQAASGPTVAEVREHLQAAMADPAAAEATASGVLVRTISADGLDPADLAGAVAVPDAPGLPMSGGRTPGNDGGARPASGKGDANLIDAKRIEAKRAEARERTLRAAREAAARTRERAEQDSGRRRDAEDEVEALDERRAFLIRELERARRDIAAVERELEKARARLASADRKAEASRRDAERARDRLEAADRDAEDT